MQITRYTTETATGPSEWFTGAVYSLHRHRRHAHGAVSPRGRQRPLHARRADRVAHPPPRADHLRHRGLRPLPAPGRRDRGDPAG